MSIVSKLKTKAGWSKWESSFYGGFLATLVNHPDIKLAKDIVVEENHIHTESTKLFVLEVIKLHKMILYYGAKYNKLFWDNSESHPLKKFSITVTEDSEGTALIPLAGFSDLLKDPQFQKEEIYPLFKNYSSIFYQRILYKVKPANQETQSNPKVPEAVTVEDRGVFEKAYLKSYKAVSATSEDLKKNTTFEYLDAYPELCLGWFDPEDINSIHKIKSTLLRILDITLDPTSYEVKSLREGQMDTRKIVTALGGDLSIYKKTLEDQIVKPFKVIVLGDLSGSMNGSLIRYQTVLMEAFFDAFSEIMPVEDIKMYGHGGDNSPLVIRIHDTDHNIYYDKNSSRITNTLSQNYDGPVIERIYEEIRKKDDSNYLFIYLSDGEPSGFQYGGFKAMEELKRVSERCKRDNFVIVGLGLDTNHLGKMYHYHHTIPVGSSGATHDVVVACKTINAAIKDVFM